MTPIDADCHTDWASTPVNTNVVISMPPGVAEAGLERRPEQQHEDERQREVGGDPQSIAEQLDQVAMGDDEDGRELSRHPSVPRSVPRSVLPRA